MRNIWHNIFVVFWFLRLTFGYNIKRKKRKNRRKYSVCQRYNSFRSTISTTLSESWKGKKTWYYTNNQCCGRTGLHSRHKRAQGAEEGHLPSSRNPAPYRLLQFQQRLVRLIGRRKLHEKAFEDFRRIDRDDEDHLQLSLDESTPHWILNSYIVRIPKLVTKLITTLGCFL